MKTCPQCTTSNRPDAKFCVKCRYDFAVAVASSAAPPAARHCTSCGAANDATAAFCTSCGAALSQSAAPALTTAPAPAQPPSPAAAPAPSQPAPAAPAPQPAAPTTIPVPPAPPPVSPPAQPAASSSPAPVDGLACSACGVVVRFCPSCGAPLVRTPDGQVVHGAPATAVQP